MFEPNVIIVGPGGLKGIMELGALQCLYERGLLKKIDKMVGCSIGAIISLLYICGYTPYEMLKLSKDFDNILRLIPNHLTISEIINNGGVIDPIHVKTVLDQYVKSKFGYIPTLQELYNITGISLCTVHSIIETCESNYIDHDNHPSILCTDAAILGINIPGIIRTGVFNGEEISDGALVNPYPINIYDNGTNTILGIYIRSVYESSSFINRSLYLMLNMSAIALRNIRKDNSTKSKCKHLELKTDVKDPTGIFLDHTKKDQLYDLGYSQCSDFLSTI